MKRLIIFILLVAAGQSGFGQAKEERKFKLKGKPILTIYANWHNGLGRANGDSGFELDRSYIGYEVDITEKLSGKVVLDIGPTNAEEAELERVAYVKNAMLSWKTGEFTLDFGLVSTTQAAPGWAARASARKNIIRKEMTPRDRKRMRDR